MTKPIKSILKTPTKKRDIQTRNEKKDALFKKILDKHMAMQRGKDNV